MGPKVAITTGPPEAGPAPWLEVWLEAGHDGRIFTYSNPAGLSAGLGDLVRVRLQGRLHTGLVVGLGHGMPPELHGKLAQPVEAVFQSAAVDARWRSLIEAVACDTHTSLFRCLKSALPPGWLGQRPKRAPLPGSGQIILVELGESPPEPLADPSPGPTARQRQLLTHLAAHGQGRLLRDLIRDGFSRSLVASLERRGWIRRRSVAPPELAAGLTAGADPSGAVALEISRPGTAAQNAAIEAITAAPGGSALLLWGVTGAGKTEVYLQAVSRERAAGRSALLLAPEIGLIPQLLDRCRARFGPSVMEYHSGMGEAERVRAWRRCLEAADGPPLVAVGTRSAVFLPLAKLGLIVLDEEHDGSYKQDRPMPCYHAREVARHRSRLEGARLVLGSATPSLETWLRCRGPSADTLLLELPERIARRPLPPVRVVDMRHELAEGHRRLISRALMERLRQLPERGEQGVVLVPRRGYRTFLSCRSCG